MALFPKFSKKREGVNVIMEQKLLQQVNNLVLNAETCTGCGICAEACPEEAITVGLVGAVRRGAVDYAEPVNIDEVKCSYCGVCVIMCPFNALTLKVDGEERLPIIEKEGFPQYEMVTKIDDEKCTRCTICEDVCPRDAIDRDVAEFEGTNEAGKKKQAAISTEIKFTVDKEKCTICGICGAICPALDVVRKQFSAESGKVEATNADVPVKFNEELCDACQVCVEACPDEAITVERVVKSKKIDGKVSIMDENCCTCRWCAINCPTEAIEVEKLYSGEIRFDADKCPAGCSTCVEVCPANAIYLPSPVPAKELKGQQEAKIAVNEDFCIFCGACVNACPGEDIIFLKRDGIRVTGKETDLFNTIKDKLFTERTSKVKEEASGEVQVKAIEKA